MRIIGIDPGLDVTGYGIIELKNDHTRFIEGGVIRTSYKEPIESRLMNIYKGLNSVITKHRPKKMILEKLYSHYKHPTTAILMGHSRGVICLVSRWRGLELISYPTKRIKKAITGNGNASKEQVQRMVQNLLGIEDEGFPVDVTDALALALAHSYFEKKYDIANIR